MRILQLTPGTGHFYCGSCLRDGALAQALMERGHDVVLVPLYLPLMLEEGTHAKTHAPPDNGHVEMGGINMYLQQVLPLLRFTPRFLSRLLDKPGLLRWASTKGNMTEAEGLGAMTLSMIRGEEGRQAHELERLVHSLAEQPRPDVILLSNVMLLGLARRLKQELGVPLVCSVQGEQPFLDSLSEPYRSEAWRTARERAREIDAFIGVSRYYADLMAERLDLPPERMHVVPNGLDLRGFEDLAGTRGAGPDRPTIGYLARMCADKGLPTLVDAFILLKQRGTLPELLLRVAGVRLGVDVKLVTELTQRLTAAGFADDVEFLPNIDRATKLAFLTTLSVFSVPATYGESFGLYLLEALAAGVPVAQPRHASFPEIIAATEGGVLCEPDDAASLADALEGLLTDDVAARAMGERGRAAVFEHYNVGRMAADVERVFESVALSRA